MFRLSHTVKMPTLWSTNLLTLMIKKKNVGNCCICEANLKTAIKYGLARYMNITSLTWGHWDILKINTLFFLGGGGHWNTPFIDAGVAILLNPQTNKAFNVLSCHVLCEHLYTGQPGTNILSYHADSWIWSRTSIASLNYHYLKVNYLPLIFLRKDAVLLPFCDLYSLQIHFAATISDCFSGLFHPG